MRKGFGRERLLAAFGEIGKVIGGPVEVFLLGGGAMCFRNQKNATKDLDLVFSSEAGYQLFTAALRKAGFKEYRPIERAYAEMEASSIWQNKDGFRLDLFVRRVCNALSISESMEKRSELLGQFGKLAVKMVSNEDVILFKGITERPRDADDIAAIIRSSRVDWDVMLEECERQSVEGRVWYGPVHNKFELLKKRYGIDVPIRRKLLAMYEREFVSSTYKRYLKAGMSRDEALSKLRKQGFTKKELVRLNSNGAV
jgi:hypothetical protein